MEVLLYLYPRRAGFLYQFKATDFSVIFVKEDHN